MVGSSASIFQQISWNTRYLMPTWVLFQEASTSLVVQPPVPAHSSVNLFTQDAFSNFFAVCYFSLPWFVVAVLSLPSGCLSPSVPFLLYLLARSSASCLQACRSSLAIKLGGCVPLRSLVV